ELPLEREDGPLARIVVPVPQGENVILLRFDDTPVRQAGFWIAMFGWLVLLAVILAGLAFRVWRRG
ncbi:MAG: hypothetical protein KC487_03345, partial [Anaerolineae bacterium]|nr:hypothetical protein [Anaerolineae bacterium]